MRMYSNPHKPLGGGGYMQVDASDYSKVDPSYGPLNSPNQQIYKPEIDYAKLVDELLKRIRQDAGEYRYRLPGYPQGSNEYWYVNPAVSQANSEKHNIIYSKGNDQRDSAHSEWMM